MGNLRADKKNFLQLPLLLLLWFLVKIGNLGIAFLNFFVKLFISFFLKTVNFFSFNLFQTKPKKKSRNKLKKSVFRQTLNLIFPTPVKVVLFIVTLGFFFSIYSYLLVNLASDIPSPNNLKTLPTPTTTEFYDRNGTLLYRFYEDKNRLPVNLSQIPPQLINATIAMEDKHFYHHFGVDFEGILRAALAFIKDGEVQGGSTITQQLIKNTLLSPERTVRRKIKEVILAFWTEKVFNKNQILEMYFNEVPFGGTAWGIAAASEMYFGKNVSDLNLAESSYLAGLPASPTTYSPYGNNPNLAKLRQKQVLRRMVEEKMISQVQADEAFNTTLEIKQPTNEIHAPHFVMFIRSLLSEKFGARFVAQGGLKVYTTLDLSLQEKAEKIVAEEVEKIKNLNVSNGAAMITDAKTGQILAMVGSKNYWDEGVGNFNVTTALRQPGSSIKPVTYATAFKLGYTPGNTLLDTPITFKNFWETYTPVNYDNRFHGAVTIRTALGSSYNIPAVKMLSVIGLGEFLKTAKDLGITSLEDQNRYGLSLTLGGGEVKMIDMMSVYGTFSQNGKKHSIIGIQKIVDTKGNILEENLEEKGSQVLSPSVAFMITDILADNKARTPAFGPNSLLNIPGKIVAVKTGTTNDKRDNVTYGYTPEFVVGVWVGNNNNSPMNPSLTSGVTGAAPIWNKLMTEVLKDRPNIAFEKPAEIITGNVDGHKDLVISNSPSKTLVYQNKRKVRDESSGQEKEVITFTDPLSVYQSDQSGQPIQINR